MRPELLGVMSVVVEVAGARMYWVRTGVVLYLEIKYMIPGTTNNIDIQKYACIICVYPGTLWPYTHPVKIFKNFQIFYFRFSRVHVF